MLTRRLIGAAAAITSVALTCDSCLPVYCDETEYRSKWDSNWDRRASCYKNNVKNFEERSVTATRHIILIRHGQYVIDAVADKKVLTECGRSQALATGERLKLLGLRYVAIIHSTMVRAEETARLMKESLPDLPLRSTELLCEGSPVRPEPSSSSWKPKPWHTFQDGARIEYAFRQFFHRADQDQTEDSYEILVCHANVIRYFVCRALQLPPEAWLRMSIGHCGITWISIRPNGHVSLKKLGDTGHLPPDLLTFS